MNLHRCIVTFLQQDLKHRQDECIIFNIKKKKRNARKYRFIRNISHVKNRTKFINKISNISNCKLYTNFHQLISFPNSYHSERHYSKQNSISFLHPSNLVFESNHSVHSTFPEKHTVFNRCTSTQSRD